MLKPLIMLAVWLAIVPVASADEEVPAWMSDAVHAGQERQRKLDAEHEEQDKEERRYKAQLAQEEHERATDRAALEVSIARLRRQEKAIQAESLRRDKELAGKPPARLGMTPEQVAKSTRWGWPTAGSRKTINTHGITEFWHYTNGGTLMFTNGKLTSMSY